MVYIHDQERNDSRHHAITIESLNIKESRCTNHSLSSNVGSCNHSALYVKFRQPKPEYKKKPISCKEVDGLH